ncbi:hypothetical protein CBR_g45621 [Chara braunii]|uniref:Uncharacterized protein n=1 Tax=Chara braunii TaxID=69332 RepID=A0A388LZ82_CHABU|nr:hypothetical protein CBR_g45621 [Chara braunii]|eukprot:GBG87563.1 hypothetical protein CBR_g45621 [Chara braunii]
MLGGISTFVAPATISEQLDNLKTKVRQLHQPPDNEESTSALRPYKMPTFQIEKFDDYTHHDPVVWWQGFTKEIGIHEVSNHLYISGRFLYIKGGCQIWLNHMATIHDVQVSNLRKKRSRDDMTKEWKKWFIVDDAPVLAISRLFVMTQGNTATRDWLTEWKKLVATPDLELPFSHLPREFYNRWSVALSLALGDREQYTTFTEIIDKAFEIIKTNRAAAHEKSAWQPAHVEKGKFGPHPQAVSAVQPDNIVEPQHHVREIVWPLSAVKQQQLPWKREGENRIVGRKWTASTMGQVQLDRGRIQVPQSIRLLLLVQQRQAQDLPMPRSRQGGCSTSNQLGKLSCTRVMAQLRDYLRTAVPAPLMDAGVGVVDLRDYLAKINCEFKTQQYDNNDTPLLYIRIQIGEATCSALIDCGATRNYMNQDFMVRVGLGPHVRRKSKPTQVTLADGHTHKSISWCIDSIPVYFAPHASEVVSFDILDTKFDMILGMLWLRSEDHPVNFYHRTVHVRDRNGILVTCTVPPPHPSINYHMVYASSIRASITKDDIEEMGVCFLHALPPHDIPSTDASTDLRIIELLDAYAVGGWVGGWIEG